MLVVGSAVQSGGQSPPQREIDHVANQEKRQIQIGLLEFEYGVRGDEIGMRPGIKAAESQKKRKSQSGQQGERTCGRFERPADRQSPKSAGKVMEHQKRGAAK